MLHVPVFLRYTLISGIGIFHSLPSSIRGSLPRSYKSGKSSKPSNSPKTGDMNYGMIAHGNDKGRNTAIHGIIARLCSWHRAELSMHFFGRIGWENADGAPISKR